MSQDPRSRQPVDGGRTNSGSQALRRDPQPRRNVETERTEDDDKALANVDTITQAQS